MINIFVVHSPQAIHGAFLFEAEAKKFSASLNEAGVTVSMCPFYQGKQEIQNAESETGYGLSDVIRPAGGFRGG